MIYAALFAFAIVPSACAGVANAFRASFGIPLANVEEGSIVRALFLAVTLFTLPTLRATSRQTFDAISRDLRVPSIVYYVAAFGLGFALSLRSGNRSPHGGPPHLRIPARPAEPRGSRALLDRDEQHRGQEHRLRRPPLPPHGDRSGQRGSYARIGWWALAFSLVAAALVSPLALLFMGLIVALYCLYSLEPFRLKRIPILSKLVVGASTLAAAMIGFTLYGGNPLHFPLPFALLFLVAVSLVANVLDLDDRDADKAAGIRTLPVMVGDRVSRILIAVACVASFGWVYAILGRSTLLAPMVVLAALSAGLILWRRIRRSILIWSAVAGLTLLATAVLLP